MSQSDERSRLRALVDIANLSGGWDDDGSLGPKPPMSWETVARMAMDIAHTEIARSGMPHAFIVSAERGERLHCYGCGEGRQHLLHAPSHGTAQ